MVNQTQIGTLTAYTVTINYGVTTHRCVVEARCQEEAFWQAVDSLKLDYNKIYNTVEVTA
jgi:hypothetical protein